MYQDHQIQVFGSLSLDKIHLIIHNFGWGIQGLLLPSLAGPFDFFAERFQPDNQMERDKDDIGPAIPNTLENDIGPAIPGFLDNENSGSANEKPRKRQKTKCTANNYLLMTKIF